MALIIFSYTPSGYLYPNFVIAGLTQIIALVCSSAEPLKALRLL